MAPRSRDSYLGTIWFRTDTAAKRVRHDDFFYTHLAILEFLNSLPASSLPAPKSKLSRLSVSAPSEQHLERPAREVGFVAGVIPCPSKPFTLRSALLDQGCRQLLLPLRRFEAAHPHHSPYISPGPGFNGKRLFGEGSRASAWLSLSRERGEGK